jgi:hypothetical protein
MIRRKELQAAHGGPRDIAPTRVLDLLQGTSFIRT